MLFIIVIIIIIWYRFAVGLNQSIQRTLLNDFSNETVIEFIVYFISEWVHFQAFTEILYLGHLGFMVW